MRRSDKRFSQLIMKKSSFKISYGKNVYDKKEINAVINTLRKSTQMGNSVSMFESKISSPEVRHLSCWE